MSEWRTPYESAGGERRREILAAAQRCVARRGVHSTTMREIARESGTSASTVYRYFEGKTDMMRYLAEGVARSDAAAARWISGTLKAPDRFVATGADSPYPELERLWGHVQSTRGGRAREEDRLRIELWAEAARDPGVAQALCAGVEMMREALPDTGTKGADRPAIWGTDTKTGGADYRVDILVAAFYGSHMLRSLHTSGRETSDPPGPG